MIRRPLHRSDSNRSVIVDSLREVGVRVYDLGQPVDLLTMDKKTRTVRLIEIKSGPKKKLTPDQQKFIDEWGLICPIFRVETVEQALAVHNIHVD